MWPFPNPLDLFGDAVGGVVGWAWDKVIQGIYTWFANGLLLLMEWVWNVLDTATTPRVTEAWFTNGLIRPLAGVAVGITVATPTMPPPSWSLRAEIDARAAVSEPSGRRWPCPYTR